MTSQMVALKAESQSNLPSQFTFFPFHFPCEIHPISAVPLGACLDGVKKYTQAS